MNLNKLDNFFLFSLKNKVTIVAGASKGMVAYLKDLNKMVLL